MFMNLFAVLAIILIFAAILRRVEVRLALLVAGFVLAVASWKQLAWSDVFIKGMITAGLISVILPAMGFAAFMELTGCDRQLVKCSPIP
jgi:DcuC family C4-dicarboxylate transporter